MRSTRGSSIAIAGTVIIATVAGCNADPSTMPDGTGGSSGAFTSIDVPGAIVTYALDISTSGAIVGRFADADGGGHGFLRDTTGAFKTIDFPGAAWTAAAAINDSGDVVGWYGPPDAPDDPHGYMRRHGSFTTFDPPGSTYTNAKGINERGDISGTYVTADGVAHGFLLRNGQFTTIDIPSAQETNVWKINASGTMVGQSVDASGFGHLFKSIWSGSTLRVPIVRSVDDHNGGINSRGDLVGTYCDDASSCGSSFDSHHGFLIRDRAFTTIDVVGASFTFAFGINDRGQIVGGYGDAQGTIHGFLLDP
jgi:uncharacterized membrane protein